jgi:hypothetical protein
LGEVKALDASRTLATTVALTTALLGCSGQATQSAPPAPAAQSSPTGAQHVERSCPVTLPNGSIPYEDAGFNHGNGSLWVALWPRGRLLAGPLPDGSSWAEIRPDGSIDAKLGWWRGLGGRLTVQGRRLDAKGPPLRASIPQGYGWSGFQATGVIFPTEGCWQVTGKAGQATLRFVALVVKQRPS